jgi:hypothetical protein
LYFNRGAQRFSFGFYFSVYASDVEPDPHHFGNLDPDPHPDPLSHQIKIPISIRIRIK